MLESILLGLLQGVSEFLPISSDGHLALAGILFGVEDAGLTLTVLLHVGTLVATALVLRRRLTEAFLSGFRALVQPKLFVSTPGGRDALFVVLASLPTAVLGLSMRDVVAEWTQSPLIIGLGFLCTATLLVASSFASPGDIEYPSWKVALLLGVVQGIAVLPGVSRSGSTIAVALFLGVQRGRAFELSMLMSVPAVFGAALLELPSAIGSLQHLESALVGTAVACVSGVAAMLFLRRMVVRGYFPWFAVWVGPLAIATLAMAQSWPH
jgi:undecaprenyl-diphosphatase